MPDIQISKEFEQLITPLSKEEYTQLKINILEEGCRDPLIVWDNKGKTILVDGHHRLKICTEKNIAFKTQTIQFKNKNEAKEWILKNQLGRRNLNPQQVSYYRGNIYLSTKQTKGGHEKVLAKGSMDESTAESLAKEFKSSAATIKRDAQFAIGLSRIEKSNPELKREILAGNIKVNKSDIAMLSTAEKDFEVSNETDIKDLAAYLRKNQISQIEKDLAEIDKTKKVEAARETLREKEPMFLDREDQINTIKGKIISAINEAIRDRNLKLIDKIKELIDKLEMAISRD